MVCTAGQTVQKLSVPPASRRHWSFYDLLRILGRRADCQALKGDLDTHFVLNGAVFDDIFS